MKPYLNINGQKLHWSYYGKVKRLCNKDMDTTIDLFWRARDSSDIPKYIAAAFRDGWWCHESKERSKGQMEVVREWWDEITQPKKPASMKVNLKR